MVFATLGMHCHGKPIPIMETFPGDIQEAGSMTDTCRHASAPVRLTERSRLAAPFL